jgi:high-affinity iron transporter
MSSHGKELATQMKSVGGAVQSGKRPLSALMIVVAIAVLREGSEVVLFLYGQAASGAGVVEIAAGIALGVVGGVAIGFLLYFGLLGIPMRYFFSATNWLMLLLAAGLASQAAGFLIQADVLPAFGNRVWDSSALLSNGSLMGKTLHTLIGYDAQPAGMQLLFYAVTAIAIAIGMKVWGGSKPAHLRVPRAHA